MKYTRVWLLSAAPHFRNIAPRFRKIAPHFRKIAPQLRKIAPQLRKILARPKNKQYFVCFSLFFTRFLHYYPIHAHKNIF